jgi:antitoxin component of MazEF toxin-antitoxin module
MRVQFSRWGNSLALRIPAVALVDIGASEGMAADLTVEKGKLVVTPIAAPPHYSFDELLAGITQDDQHDELFEGPPAGNEIW